MSRGRDDDYDDDEDDRPRRRRRDDDDDDRGRRELSGLDKMYANTSVPVLVLFGLCCGLIALILSAIALGVCKDERARSNAKMTLIISIVMVVIGVVLQIVSVALQQGNPRF